MPLMTRIVRDGEPLAMPYGWGWWHVSVMQHVSEQETGAEWPNTPLGESGRQALANAYTYEDPSDGEILELRVGDELEMWRS